MDDVNMIISQIEQALQLKLEQEENDKALQKNTYKSDGKGNITELSLSDIHFENFDALAPVFRMIKGFSLTNCSVEHVQEFLRMEYVNKLTLDNVVLNDVLSTDTMQSLGRVTLSNFDFAKFDTLASIFWRVNYFNCANCTVDDLSVFLQIDYIEHLYLDNVKLKNTFNPATRPEETRQTQFNTVKLVNMDVLHPGFLLPISQNLEYLTFSNCKLSNYYELNLLPDLYSIALDNTLFCSSSENTLYKADPKRICTFLRFRNMKLEDFDYFIPASESIKCLELENCVVGSLGGIHKFGKLETVSIDSSTKVLAKQVPSEPQHPVSFQLKKCSIVDSSIDPYKEPVEMFIYDMENLVSIASYINRLEFISTQPGNPEVLKYFTRLDKLLFTQCKVDLNLFLPVAHQIKNISYDYSKLEKTEVFSHFRQLEKLTFYSRGGSAGLADLKKLLPLKDQLKVLNIQEDDVENLHEIQAFQSLENLTIFSVSGEIAQLILSIHSLKELVLSIETDSVPEEAPAFDLKGIENILNLSLGCGKVIVFKGEEHLKDIKRLELENCNIKSFHAFEKLEFLSIDRHIDFRKIPLLPSLKTLKLDVSDDYEVHTLEQFPNLEKLEITSNHIIHFGRLEKLKILVLPWVNLASATCFDSLPNLEQLDLAYGCNPAIRNLDQLTNLKILNLEENKLENIEGLEPLKKLEKLNLYDNKISDFSVLNKLPNLKEVNIALNEVDKLEVKKQLDKPEIVRSLGYPTVLFSIRIDK